MRGYLTIHRKKIVFLYLVFTFCLVLLCVRLFDLMVLQSAYYTDKATQLHERERKIKAARGQILDRNGVVLASNKAVCTISVIHSQIEDEDAVVKMLCKELDMEQETVKKKVSRVSSIERIKSNVEKETGDRIREYALSGVKVDDDYKRFYPYDSLASTVLGFTGSDNQGIIGLEVMYEDVLKGTDGIIYTTTDARGIELDRLGESRKEPIEGNNLVTTIDYNIQSYATMLATQVLHAKEAEGVSVLCMNPQNGEMLACVNVPEFNLNEPFSLTEEYLQIHQNDLYQNEQDERNRMWRNNCINDTYEPGSTFKTVTAAAALEEGVVSLSDSFHCQGYCVVEDRRIRCHKTTGHGSEDFVTATMNSCNPVFVNVGLRLGAEKYYDYFKRFGLLEKTGIDLPGEAKAVMHKKEDIKAVELATISFGQSFQITPLQLLTTVSAIINGGKRVVPHFAQGITSPSGEQILTYTYASPKRILSVETSEKMCYILEQVVKNGGGKNGSVEGYAVGGKTATSQTLPRGSGRYISSFVGFAPVKNPQVITLVVIRVPKGV